MRNPDRIPLILKRLENVWKKHSDLRLGQIFVSSDSLLKQKGINMFALEDDELIDEIEKLFEEIKMKDGDKA